NPKSKGYPLQVFLDDLDLTVEPARFNFENARAESTWKKERFQPVPKAAIDALIRATNDRPLVYAALLLAHQGVLPGAMCGVAENLTLLSSGVAIGPMMPGNLQEAAKRFFHINTSSRTSLLVTHVMERSQEDGRGYLTGAL